MGDPEAVVDSQGQLPADRRATSLLYYDIGRRHDVERLFKERTEKENALIQASGRSERSQARNELERVQRELQKLLDIPVLESADMCADCIEVWAHHGWTSPRYVVPCPAWPGWGARLDVARKIIFDAVAKAKTKSSSPSKPRPLVELPANLPIEEMISRLEEVRQNHPSSIVKRGRGGRTEIWPNETWTLRE